MAKLPAAFNSEDHDDIDSYEAIPANDYHVKIIESSMAENSKKTGSYVKFKFKIMTGEYKGRLLFTNLNLVHSNPQAVEIAEKTLATMLRACGKVSIEDTDELHGCELMAKVTIKPASAQYPAGNEVKNYSAIDGLAQPKQTAKTENKPRAKNKVTFD